MARIGARSISLNRGKVIAVCTSERKGTQKTEVPSIKLVPGYGIEGDAHAGNWHRQVSLLDLDKIEAFRARGANVAFGAFGENIVVEGFDFRNLPVGTRFRINGSVLLEMTQIGKECHNDCAIKKAVGKCVMPTEGIFAVVVKEGVVRPGDEIEVLK